LAVRGPLAANLSAAFDEMFAQADFRHPPFSRCANRRGKKLWSRPPPSCCWAGRAATTRSSCPLRRDLVEARSVRIICAYFLPPWRIRRHLMRAARQGARVQLILPGKSDLPFSRLAGQSFYRRLLMAGVEIYEYQPQILHAKMFLMDDIVYVGSANLDPRALDINYELMLRLSHPGWPGKAPRFSSAFWPTAGGSIWKAGGKQDVDGSIQIALAYLLLARLDPMVAQWQWRWIGAEKGARKKLKANKDYLASATAR
jgi:cardiolipin synthase